MAYKKKIKSQNRLALGAGHARFEGFNGEVFLTQTNNITSFKANAEADNTEVPGGDGQPIMTKVGATKYTIELNLALQNPLLLDWLEGRTSEEHTEEIVVPETTNAKVGSDGKLVIVSDDPEKPSDIKKILDASVTLADNTALKKVETDPKTGEFMIDAEGKGLTFDKELAGEDVIVSLKMQATNIRTTSTPKTPVRPEFKLIYTTNDLPQGKEKKVRKTIEFMRVQLDQPVPISATNNPEEVVLTFKTLSSSGCTTVKTYEREVDNEVC